MSEDTKPLPEPMAAEDLRYHGKSNWVNSMGNIHSIYNQSVFEK